MNLININNKFKPGESVRGFLLSVLQVNGTCKNHYLRIFLYLLLQIMHLYFVLIECKNCSSKLHLLMNQHLFYGSLGAPYGRLDGVQGPQAVQRVPMVEC